ncbi:MAG: hypothetical protein U0M37_05445, partial [Blautia sp.]
IGTDPQCFKYYNGVFSKTQEIGRKENNPLPSKEDNWIIRVKNGEESKKCIRRKTGAFLSRGGKDSGNV